MASLSLSIFHPCHNIGFLCAGSTASTPAETHSPSHGRGLVEVDSDTSSPTEKSRTATREHKGSAASVFMCSVVLPPSLLLLCMSLLQIHHHLPQSMLEKRKLLQTLKQRKFNFYIPLVSVLLCTWDNVG